MPLLQVARSTGITGAPWDEHGLNRAVNTSDTSTVFLFNAHTPLEGRNTGANNAGYPGGLPGYGELTGMAAQPVSGCTSSIATFCQYRFAHFWNTGNVNNYNEQNNWGMNSQDSVYAVFTSDVMGSRGSTSPDWTSGGAHSLGDMVNPVCVTASGTTTCNPTGYGNANHSSFQILSGTSCTSGSTEPQWSTAQTTGNTIGDGSCTWTNVSGHYGSQQLPCNGLRGDLSAAESTGAEIYSGTTVFDTSSGNIYQATSVSPSTGWTSPPYYVISANDNWSKCAFGQTCGDGNSTSPSSDGITWTYLGQNDCRADDIVVDLTSAQPL